ncbi:glyoxalase [Tardibacter chloracetimidivorans]|uniref:Glyoxalase n=1 Tax=Tardibacter chloracetimidivorans TaxID=1921510 RepID=A0A1L3ZTT4_9SPHN|nr:VOC family protein [Tardibacter chloracetimidivorans]API59052.1 glyoxalase [Tardibacter chloracetimidivorans]
MTTENAQLPEGGFPLAPHIVCSGAADAIEFYKKAFGATEMMRIPGPDGRLMHGAVLINGAMVMLVDEMPEHGTLSPKKLGGTPVVIHLTVPDVDAFVDKAVTAGAELKMPPQDMFWGDRYGQVEDPFGHLWSIATPLRGPMSEEELKAAAQDAMCGAQPQ